MNKWWINIINCFKKQKAVFAVSGGPDSMAMLDLYLKHVAVVCHVNYNKRDNSANDFNVVKQYCDQHNLKLEFLNVNQTLYYEYKDIDNFQAQARAIRYDFFNQIAKKYNLKVVYVAHNLDDWIETAYMQKARNSKALFYGIRAKSAYKELIIKRPVLNYRKTTLLRHCTEHKIPFVTDETNNLPIYERNQVRKQVSTWSSEQFKDFYDQIKRYNKQNRWLDENVQMAWNEFVKTKYDYGYYSLQADSIQYHLLFRLLNAFEIKNVSANKITGIMGFLANKHNITRKFRVQDQQYISVNQDHKIYLAIYNKDNDDYLAEL